MEEGDPTAAGLPLRAVLAEVRQGLAAGGIPDPGFEARVLTQEVSGLSAADLLTRPDLFLLPRAVDALREAARRRAAGEPLHRILGWREFYGLRLALSPETLEPRPDTETLVDAVLPFVRETARRKGTCRILDLGTGTGAIALALLAQVEEAEAVGVDLSEGALATAAANARAHCLEDRFRPLLSDWWENVSGRFALIVANPPYISHTELALLAPAVALHDPGLALDGGADGLDAYRILAAGAANHLEDGGLIGLEIGCGQRETVASLFLDRGFRMREARRDLGGNDRVLVFEPSGNAMSA